MEVVRVDKYCRMCRKTTPHEKELDDEPLGVVLGIILAILTYSILIPWCIIAEIAGLGFPPPILNFGIVKPYFCLICSRPRYF